MRLILGALCALVSNVVTALVVLSGLALWQLGGGAIPVDELTPYLEEAVADGPVDIAIGATTVQWYGPELPLGVTLNDVMVSGEDGDEIARVAEMWVGLSVPHLLAGDVVPTEIVLIRPQLQIVRDGPQDYSIAVLDEAGQSASGGGQADLDALLVAVAQPPGDGGDPLSAVWRLRIHHGEVAVEDRVLGVETRIQDATIRLDRGPDALHAEGAISVPLGDQPTSLQLSLAYPYGSDSVDLRLDFSDLVPAGLADRHAALVPLAAVNLPVGGWVEGRLSVAMQPLALRVHAESRSGRVDLPGLFPEPLGLAGVMLDGTVDFERPSLAIEALTVDFGGPRIEATADGSISEGMATIVGQASLHDMPVDLLDTFWPPPLGPGARAWVTENLSQGIVRLATAEFLLSAPSDDWSGAAMTRLDGEMALEDMTIRYIDGMPPITGLAGQVSYDLDRFSISTTGGTMGGLRVTESEMLIYDFDRPNAQMEIDVVVQGGVQELLSVLDNPVLGYASAVGLHPWESAGRMSGRLRFSFPLIDELPLDRVAIAASANLRGTRLGELMDGVIVDGVNGALTLDGQRMTLNGEGRANGVPLAFQWEEPFTPTVAVPRRLTVSGALDAAARSALGLDLHEGMTGITRVEAAYADLPGGRDTVEATVDLTEAAFAIEPLDWAKPVGRSASLEAAIELIDGVPLRLSRFAFQGGDLWASGSLELTGDGGIRDADLPEIGFRDNRLAARVTRVDGGGLAVELRGPRLNLSPYVDALASGRGSEATEETDSGGETAAVTLAFDRVDLDETRWLTGVNGYLTLAGPNLQQANLAAQTANGGQLQLTYQPSGAGANFTVLADNAGTVLRDLDVLETMHGGRLNLIGARADATAAYRGSLRVESFRLQDAPAIAHIFSAMSFGGLADLLSTEGLAFDGLAVDFAMQNNVIDLREGRAGGGALGLTLDGRIDLNASTIGAEGTIVPIYGVNEVIGAIPILGDLLTGGDGGGLFAFTYSVDGPLDSPSASVNPLSVLAPGFLRRVFFLGEFDEVAEEPSDLPAFPDGPEGR